MLHNLTSAAPLVPPTASSSEKAPRLWAASGVHTFLDHFYLASNQSRRHFHRENIDLCNTSTKLLICNMQFRHIAQKIDASGKCQWHIKKPCTSSPDRQTAFICCIYFVLFVLEVLVTTRQVFLNGVVFPSPSSWAMEQLFHQLSSAEWGPFSFSMAQDTAYLQFRSGTLMASLWHMENTFIPGWLVIYHWDQFPQLCQH